MQKTLSIEVMPSTQENGSAFDDFEELVERYRPRIFRFILASLRDRESSENLTQDCFVRAYKARDQLRDNSTARTWLMQIAANLVRSHEASGRLKFWRRALRTDVDLSDAGGWLMPDSHISPEEMAEVKQKVARVWKVAARLSAKQRTVFLLRFVEEMELLEIAEATGMREPTVKTHLARALESMRAAFEGKR